MFQTKERSVSSGEKALNEEEVAKLLKVIDKIDDYTLILLTLDVGIRREDVVAIKSRDVNLEREEITFYQKKKKRTITRPLGDKTVQALRMWLNVNKNDYLFPGREKGSEHLSGRTAYNILGKYCEKAGIPKRPFHALRSTCIKLKQKKGWAITDTARMIDDSVRVVEEHYSTPSDAELKILAKEKPIL